MSNSTRTRDLCEVAIFAAIIAVCAQISMPFPYGVPFTLQTFALTLAGIVLGAKKGTVAALVYVALGIVGVPVFNGFKGGFALLVGPTGGFILSFPVMVLIIGLFSNKSKWLLCVGILFGVLVNYLCGILVFSVVMSSSLQKAVASCIVPFLFTDILKMIAAFFLGTKVRALRLGKTTY